VSEKPQGMGESGGRKPRSSSGKKFRYGGTEKRTLEHNFSNKISEYHEQAKHRFEKIPLSTALILDPEAPPQSFEFDWPLKPIPLSVESQIAQFVVKRGEYGWVEDERLEEIAVFVEPSQMSLDQALSLRSALLQQKTVYSHGRLKSKGKELARQYRQGESVLSLSKKYDFPPMNTFRIILESMSWSKQKIKVSLREPSKMNEREQNEFEACEAADRVTSVDQSETQQIADQFENELAEWFESQGVRLRRQPEIAAEQMEEHGRPIRTPDILFLDHVTIHGQPVAWIDAKHFYGADVNFQRKKTQKQMQRYIDEWGSGAIVFRHGFCENLFIPGVLMLDAGPLQLDSN